LPLVDHKGVLVGVMQVLNKIGGAFDRDDEALATALAAQCAVALQRVRMTSALIEGEKMRQALEMAREVQMSTLPSRMPALRSYDLGTLFRPAELTGGDTYDVSLFERGLVIVLGDATGHGIAPALSVTQMQAMLRMAFQLGAPLETAFIEVNNRLAETLAEDRFITAFLGLLDPATHRLRFQSGGQGPILHYRAASRTFGRYRPTSFPLGAMTLTTLRPAIELWLRPGDILAVVSDGVFEQENRAGEQFGEARVQEVIGVHAGDTMADLAAKLLARVGQFADGAPQEDDMTAILLRRAPEDGIAQEFARSFDSIPALVQFTADGFDHLALDPRVLPVVDLAVEELFTNMVKYGRGSRAPVRLDLSALGGGAEVALTDRDVDPFDITQAPEVDITRVIEERVPGGLGLHLVRQMADEVEYDYNAATRESRITLRISSAGIAARRAVAMGGGEDARD
jgi:phosphoserine phosphatase